MMQKPTELEYYAAARDDGWSYGDEDTPEEYCRVFLRTDEIAAAIGMDTSHWVEEYNWWQAKP